MTATTTALPVEVRDLAGKTAAEIRNRGWHQGSLIHFAANDTIDTCKVCLYGGILAATGQLHDGVYPGSSHLAARWLLDVLKQELAVTEDDWLRKDAVNVVVRWNDKPERTEAEVLDVLDRIAGTR